ncbi:MAG: translation initiation factor IF-3 [Proteobacteria bacterium]|nr:translation initiation factor IF-3 [Pseudomonadota bacterium]
MSARQTRSQKSRNRINRQIRAREVRLVGPEGHHIGIVPLQEALVQAQEAGFDLVEISPNASPPVCKIMDHGKFLYEKAKREREARKAQKQIEVKEIRLRPKTSGHHRSFKVRNARRWLGEGMKVRVRIRFRGREFHYPEIARNLLKGIADELDDIGAVEQHPNMEGRTMLMILGPKKGV